MSELIKRFFTSIILISLLFLSIVNIYVLTTLLIIIFYQIIYEFYFLFKKNIKFDEKFKLYLLIVLTLIYIGYFNIKIFIIFLNNNSSELLLLYFIITICIFSDIGGYVFGKIFRGKKLTKISPNKTISGLLGSYIFSIISVVIIFHSNYIYGQLENFSLLNFLYIFVISTISQIGDIIISYFKRLSNVKNTGNVLPGHGGLLDRIDGLIFVFPVIFVLVSIIKLIK